MFVRFLTSLLFTLVAIGGEVLAASISVIQDGNVLILSNQGKLRKVTLPAELRNAGNFTLRVEPEKKAETATTNVVVPSITTDQNGGSNNNRDAGQAARSSIETLLVRANLLFKKRRFEEAMYVLDSAEAASPKNARVKSMKGSLYYLLGFKQFARDYWKAALTLDGQQTDVQAYLAKVEGELGTAHPAPAVVE